MSEFDELVQVHERLVQELIEDREPEENEVTSLLSRILAAAKTTYYIEDRQELRYILRYWAGYLALRGRDYPDIDFDSPERLPQRSQYRSRPVKTPLPAAGGATSRPESPVPVGLRRSTIQPFLEPSVAEILGAASHGSKMKIPSLLIAEKRLTKRSRESVLFYQHVPQFKEFITEHGWHSEN